MERTTKQASKDTIIPEEVKTATDESKEEAEATADESKEESEEQVEAAEVPDENEIEQKAIDKMIREDLDKAKKMLKTARQRVQGEEDLEELEAASNELHNIILALEIMFELIKSEGSQKQKKEYNILMKLTFNLQMDCLHSISWIQAEQGLDLWDCQDEKKYWPWRRTIRKYIKYFPEDMTTESLIQEYMRDCKEREAIQEKIQGCESAEEALMKIDSIFDRNEEFRREEERLKIYTNCREDPCYGSYFEKENAKKLLSFIRKVENYNKVRRDEGIKQHYHLGRRFKIKFLSKLSQRSARDVVLNAASWEDMTMKTYKKGLKNILERFPDYPKEWFVAPRGNEEENEENEQGYETDEEICDDDDDYDEGEEQEATDQDYDF